MRLRRTIALGPNAGPGGAEEERLRRPLWIATLQACRKFIYTENLLPDAEVATLEEGPSRKALEPPRAAIPILNKAIAQLETEDGWVGLDVVGQRLANIASDFDFAYLRLSETQRSGPQDRSVRHGAAEGRGHADQGKDNSAIKNRFEGNTGMTAKRQPIP